ncbi:hypothetical protein [Streptomyces phage JXY1]|uniref:Uncharacterized protein n=1 Tax=Streptomyces phage JXY1 TaxID=2708562 RepID=A0A6C0RSA4_9CAUD|nr:hypothetical protein HWD10_gp22 [Streptomyces phage JXY1]QIA28855.1 hypothetical protein [Streptomyces phage JXY1]
MSQMNPVSSAGTSSSEREFGKLFIETALMDLGVTLQQKNSDYKIDGEFSNFEYAAEIAGTDTLGAIMTQIGIKLGRLKGLPEEHTSQAGYLQGSGWVRNHPVRLRPEDGGRVPSNPDNPSIKMELTFDDEVVEVELEFHFSDNAENFIDVTTFVTSVGRSLMG